MEIVNKSWLNPRWISVTGDDDRTVDAYGAIAEPDAAALLATYEDTVYTCANWIADNVSATPLKVYVKNLPGQSKPNALTAAIKHKSLRPDIRNKAEVENLREVLDHELVALLETPNPEMNRSEFIKNIDAHLSLAGQAFVRKVRSPDNLPYQLDVLQVQHCELVADREQFVALKYNLTSEPVIYLLKDIIWFKLSNPRDINGNGWSPARAAYERILLMKQELAYLASLYRNQARPDALVTVKGIGADEAERMQKEMNMRFKQGGQHGIWVTDGEEVDIENLNWSPKDMLGTELYKWCKLQIVNAFKLNLALFDTETSNRAVATEARRSAQRSAILPRCRLIEAKLNQNLVNEFDDRLVVAFDNPVEEDEDFDLQKRTQYLDRKVYTVNEVRTQENMPPVPWGDAPIDDNKPEAQEDKPGNQTDAPITNDLRSTVGGLQAIAALQESFYAGSMPREAAVANVRILFGFTQQEAESLFPDIAPRKLTPEGAPKENI